ncbi:ArnT family glycosyltransferase [Paludisphaera rhizosphaerae]|uniref:ArnT family glycosyltransferase n=1 Tax=Paludisphaera rhizosphaerae TaxID=2711216 RepID=UPI0013ECE717|nr:glycosyltransferase family 39 protein [Paludisphaera rhizosphaerae]
MRTGIDGDRRGRFWLAVAGLALLAVGPGLGWSRLSYHEAFVAQGGSEILASGSWSNPTIAGRPWLEKPPLPFWAAAAMGRLMGEVSPIAARIPSALAAIALALGVAFAARKRFGDRVGLLAGAVQATTVWAVMRGRLAEADILLAAMFAWTMAAFDRVRDDDEPNSRGWRWAFFLLLGLMSLVKGIGFGAAMAGAASVATLLWDGRLGGWRRFVHPAGWLVATLLTFAWPLLMLRQHGEGAASLWFMHVADRLGPQVGHGFFAGEKPGEYLVSLLAQGMPWVPLAILGGWLSIRRREAGDKLLWAWSAVPLAMVSLPGGRNGHYAIYAIIAWSTWAAIALDLLGDRLVAIGRPVARVRRLAVATFVLLAAGFGVGFGLIAPRFEHRSAEPTFYEEVGRLVPADEPIVLLYDDWDREPYPTPFGPIPHDLGVRLYYMGRRASWTINEAPPSLPPTPSVAVLARDRDRAALEQSGAVEVLAKGPEARWDRAFTLFRVRPDGARLARRIDE